VRETRQPTMRRAKTSIAMPVVTGTALGRQDNTDRDSTDQQGQGANGGLDAALRRFLALPGTKSFLIHVGQGGALRRIAYQPGLFPLHRQRLQDFRPLSVSARCRGGPVIRG
jgi:hypothetical protein